MKTIYMAVLCLLLLGAVASSDAQSKRHGEPAVSASSATRYFQLEIDLKFGEGPDQQARTETITTEVAVAKDWPGSCKARMISQVPTGSGEKTKYLELGTKLDCNAIHIDGDGLALQFVLDTSRISGMVKTKTSDGTEIDEPMISERTVQLTVKLPLNETKVVFNSGSNPLMPQQRKALSGEVYGKAVTTVANPAQPEQPMMIQMTARELK